MRKLRRLVSEDLKKINQWRNDRTLVSLLGNTFRFVSLERDREWLEATNRESDRQLRLGIEFNDQLVGITSLTNIDELHGTAEFSILIGEPEVRGQGLGHWATTCLVHHAFDDLRLNRIWLTVIPRNTPAIRLYEKVGFEREGTLRQALFKEGNYQDLHLMSILNQARRWEARPN